MSAEELFLQKYGNKITASESWVIRFAEDYTNLIKEEIRQFLYDEITERRHYSSSKMCEETVKFIDKL